MTRPTEAELHGALDATWPAAQRVRAGGFTLRQGLGGGKRVSAATVDDRPGSLDIAAAEAGMQALGQTPLFMLRPGDAALDAALADRGYDLVDPVVLYAAPVARIAAAPPPVTVFPIWEPLAIMAEIWTEGGVGPARLAVMHRAQAPRTGLLGRTAGRPAGAGFVACDGRIAMLHALHVRPEARRRGLARHMTATAALWAAQSGATEIALAVTRANTAANALYASLGMEVVGQYHYRMKAA